LLSPLQQVRGACFPPGKRSLPGAGEGSHGLLSYFVFALWATFYFQLQSLESKTVCLDSPNASRGLNSNILALKREERRSTISPTVVSSFIYKQTSAINVLQLCRRRISSGSKSPPPRILTLNPAAWVWPICWTPRVA